MKVGGLLASMEKSRSRKKVNYGGDQHRYMIYTYIITLPDFVGTLLVTPWPPEYLLVLKFIDIYLPVIYLFLHIRLGFLPFSLVL